MELHILFIEANDERLLLLSVKASSRVYVVRMDLTQDVTLTDYSNHTK